jgi:hypothetical protein
VLDQCFRHAVEVHSRDLGDVLAGLAVVFMGFELVMSPKIIVMQTLHLFGSISSSEGGASSKEATLLQSD